MDMCEMNVGDVGYYCSTEWYAPGKVFLNVCEKVDWETISTKDGPRRGSSAADRLFPTPEEAFKHFKKCKVDYLTRGIKPLQERLDGLKDERRCFKNYKQEDLVIKEFGKKAVKDYEMSDGY